MLNAIILSAIIKIAVSLRTGSDLRKLKTVRQMNDANDEDYVLRIFNEIFFVSQITKNLANISSIIYIYYIYLNCNLIFFLTSYDNVEFRTAFVVSRN